MPSIKIGNRSIKLRKDKAGRIFYVKSKTVNGKRKYSKITASKTMLKSIKGRKVKSPKYRKSLRAGSKRRGSVFRSVAGRVVHRKRKSVKK